MSIDATSPNTPRVLVLGDVLKDIYYLGSTSRMSAEAPIPVINVEDVKEFPGGASNVADNIYFLGSNVMLLAAEPYPLKSRVMLGENQVCRFDQQDTCKPITTDLLVEMMQKVVFDAIVISDYGKGAISDELVREVTGECNYYADTMELFVNTKRDPSVWFDCPNVTFLTNREEFSHFSDAYRRASQVIQTMGADGVVRLHKGNRVESLPAFTSPQDVVSVNGAGDTFLAAYVYATLTKTHHPLRFANAAAASVVRKPYTSTTTIEEVEAILNSVPIPA